MPPPPLPRTDGHFLESLRRVPLSLSLSLSSIPASSQERGSARKGEKRGNATRRRDNGRSPPRPHPHPHPHPHLPTASPLIDVREGERSPGPKPAEATWNPRDRSSTLRYGTSRKWSAGHISLLNPLMRVPNGNLHRLHSYVQRPGGPSDPPGTRGGLSLRQAGIQVLLIPRTLPVTPRR